MHTFLRIVALTSLVSSCTSLSVIPRYGKLDLGGHVGINSTSSGSSGTNDYKAIGLKDDSSVPSGRVDLEAGGMHTTLAISESSHGGSGTLQSTISDGTTTIPAGTSVNSDLDVVLGEAMVTWDLVPGDLVEAGIGIGASAFDLNARVTDPGTSQSVGAHAFLPIPVVTGRVGLDFGRFDASVLLGGMDVHIDGKNATLVDLDFMARLKIFGAVGRRIGAIVAGYRYVDLKVDYSDSSKVVDSTTRLSGPYIGLSIGF